MKSGTFKPQAIRDYQPVTSVRRLTAPVTSAIASIAIEGPRTLDVLRDTLLTPTGQPFLSTEPCAKFALWRFADQDLADEHVVVLVRSRESVEIHCHGGLAITEQIVGQLESAGCELRPDPSDASAQSDTGLKVMTDVHQLPDREAIRFAAEQALVKAPTLKSALVLLDQYQGALFTALQQFQELLQTDQSDEAGTLRETLIKRAHFGLRLLTPWRLTLAGPPNVGKSSLMNALCGSSRVLVHHEAGTTRDAVETSLVIGGWPVALIDTAGIRKTSEPIERQGVVTARERWRSADIGLLVVDANQGWTLEHEKMLEGPVIIFIVINKVDAVSSQHQIDDLQQAIRETIGSRVAKIVCASATTHDGVQSLIGQLEAYLDSLCPPRGSGVPFTVEQLHWLRVAGCS